MLKIKYFGMMAEVANCTEEYLDLLNRELPEVLVELNKKYALNRYTVNIAVNQKIVDSAARIILKENDEIAVLPPFSGG